VKALFIHSFLMTTLLTLVACGSKENSVSLKVTSSFAFSGESYSGGLVVSGKNAIGQRFVKTVFGGNSLKVVLPDGAWDLNVVGWDGATPFNGVPYCGKSSINLSGADASATVTINETNCRTADFSGSPYVNTGISEIYPLKIVTCGAFYKHISESSFTKLTEANSTGATSDFCSFSVHPMDLRSRTKSIKLIPIDKNFNGAYGGQPGNNPICITGSGGVFNLAQQIPVAGLPVQIAFYEDSACQKQSSFVLFPDGLKQGYAAKFDSILDNKIADTSGPSEANRLIVSDNGINRGWSPFYAQMPFFKCSTGFCGDFNAGSGAGKYSDAIFDYFMEVDYAANVPQSLTFPASSDICSSVTTPAAVSNNRLVKDSCSFSTSNGKGQITVLVKPKKDGSFCPGQLNITCSSPTYKFVLDVNGVEKEIYFSGKKDYAGSVQPVPFSHLYVTVKNYTVATACGTPGTDWLPFVGETNNVLAPEYLCVDPASTLPILLAKPFYKTSNKSFQVDDSGTYYGKIQFEDNNSDTPEYLSLLMLPPDAREQRNLTNVIFEAIGGAGWMESFKYENNYNNDYDDESRAYGSIRKAREMFSPDGPGGLFGDSNPIDACLNTVGTKQIKHTDRDGTHDYEITITNISASSSDTRHVRPDAYCHDTDLISDPMTCSPLNSGRYEKAMLIKKDGISTEVVLFDCAVNGNPSVPTQNGRLEAVYNDVEDGKYRRGKEIMFWNTYNQQYARFEKYSRSMESSTSNYAVKTYDERKFEKIFKLGLLDQIHGRVYKHSMHSSSNNQNLTAARFQLYRPASNWTYTYAFYDFHEPAATQLFASSGDYLTLKTDTFTNTHFCGGTFTFPQTFSYSTNCSANNFVALASEPTPVLGPFDSYQYIKGSNFDALINPGYFSISWP
jgi:hypothetical protein